MAGKDIRNLQELFLELLPADGAALGNQAMRGHLEGRIGESLPADAYASLRDGLVASGLVAKGRGKGGSVRLVDADAGAFGLAAESTAGANTADRPVKARKKAKKKAAGKNAGANDVLSYRHGDKRVNNPEVGMVTPETDPDEGKTRWAYDPHLDPELQFDSSRAQVEKIIDDALASSDQDAMRDALEELKRLQQPYLNWSGKAERTSFEVDTVSLHVHERIDPASILSAVRKALQADKKGVFEAQLGLFHAPFENMPLRDAIDFYKHEKGWSNRLIAGDSLLVMNSLLQKESMAGQVQMIYFDPPYGIKYGSNFQPFTNKRDVKDRKDEDLTQEPEMIKAFRDTWELGIHSYLTYLRDRLLHARELLNESGSVFVQISDENVHHVRELMDEVFGVDNFICIIAYKTSVGMGETKLDTVNDFIVWYAKETEKAKFHQLYFELERGGAGATRYGYALIDSFKETSASQLEGNETDVRFFTDQGLTSRSGGESTSFKITHFGHSMTPTAGGWRTGETGVARVKKANRIFVTGTGKFRFKKFFDDFGALALTNFWEDTGGGIQSRSDPKIYAVQTNTTLLERCILMATDPGDLVLDPTCGSGTTAYVAEKWGRRWISCDTSRVAVTLTKQRLMTASYDYYELKYPHEGLKGGFIYKTVPHITLRSIANNPEIDEIYEAMHPAISTGLEALNQALRGKDISFKVEQGGRKGYTLQFAKKDEMLEWEVSFEFPKDWPVSARSAFDQFHDARQAMQRKMDEAIEAHANQETLYDKPEVSRDKLRITGPFSVEAVPFPTVMSLDEAQQPTEADVTVARSGESARQHSWRDELLKTGVRGKAGDILKFTDLEPLPDTRNIHCAGTIAETGERVVVSFGPEHAALEQRQVANALSEAGNLFPRPTMIIFCAFTFDPEAAKDIDLLKGITALKAQMNTDLLTEDLKKNRSSNQSFWLMGQPDVEVCPVSAPKDEQGDWFQVEVHGFDYFNTKSGQLESGGKNKIAMWELDTDYDERSVFPRQVFFPMAGSKDGWMKLKKNIRAELNEARLQQYHGTVSLPFKAGENRKVAVKIIDDRGIESLKVMPLD